MSAMTAAAGPAPLSRRRDGWLGSCAGLAARWDLPVGRVRTAFAVGAPCFGLGVLVYVACWLILPAEGENGAAAGQRGGRRRGHGRLHAGRGTEIALRIGEVT